MRKQLLLVTVFIISVVGSASNCKGMNSQYSISVDDRTYSSINVVVLDKSDNLIKNGVQFLVNSLKEASQGKLILSISDKESLDKNSVLNLYVGTLQSLQSNKLLSTSFQTGVDGIVLKTLTEQGVLIGGENSNSTLYAMFYFLENVVGFRWWTPNEVYVPDLTDLQINNLDYKYTPPLYFRSHYVKSVLEDAKFAALMYENNALQKEDPAWGNNIEIFGWSHTFNNIIPIDTYFDKHPEWFSDPNNHDLPCTNKSKKPAPNETQLCLENIELLKEFIKNSREILTKNPDIKIFSISINDNRRSCHCNKCENQNRIDQNPSGSLIRFVNKVRAALKDDFPHVKFETLAYYAFLNPPKVSKPDEGIIVRIAPLDADFGHCLNSDFNGDLNKSIQGWAKINNDNHLWLYNTNFSYLLIPHPSLRGIACYLRTSLDYNIKGVFIQDNKYTDGIGYFLDMQTWVLSKLLWNPEYNLDSLVKEFMINYYGDAGEYLLQYFYLVESSFEKTGNRLVPFNLNLSYLDHNFFTQGEQLFVKALESVKDKPKYKEKVKREFISFFYANLVTTPNFKMSSSTLASLGYSNPSDDPVTIFFNLLKQYEVKRVDMKLNFKELESKMRQSVKTLESYSISSGTIDIEDDEFTLYKKGTITHIVNDPNTSNGKAAKIIGDNRDWAIQAKLTSYGTLLYDNKWDVKFFIKLKPNKEKFESPGIIRVGVYDNSLRKQKVTINTKIQSLDLNEYITIEIPNIDLSTSDFLWVSILDKKSNIEGLYVDKIVLSKTED